MIGLLAAAGVLTLLPVMTNLPTLIRAFLNPPAFGQASALIRAIAFLALLIFLIAGFFGVACLVLARLLYLADRVGRGLTYVLCGSLTLAVLFVPKKTTASVVVALVAVAAIGVLALSPAVQAFFTGPDARQHKHPVSVVVARTLIVILAACAALIGAMFLLVSLLATDVPSASVGKFVVAGAALTLGAAFLFVQSGRLAEGSRTARALVTAVVVLYPFGVLVAGDPGLGSAIPFGVAAGIAGFLWLPEHSRQFFGDATRSAAVAPSMAWAAAAPVEPPAAWSTPQPHDRAAYAQAPMPAPRPDATVVQAEPTSVAWATAPPAPLNTIDQAWPDWAPAAGPESADDLQNLEATLCSSDPAVVSKGLTDAVAARRGTRPLLPPGCRLLIERGTFRDLDGSRAVVEARLTGKSGRWQLHLAHEHGAWRLARMERAVSGGA